LSKEENREILDSIKFNENNISEVKDELESKITSNYDEYSKFVEK